MGKFDPEKLLDLAIAAPELLEDKVVPEPVASRTPTYDDLMELLRRVEDQPFGWEQEIVHPDVFADMRQPGETRTQAKNRIWLQHHAEDGRVPSDADLWKLRAQYVRMYQFVQIDGRPYSTHNWAHYYNRYGIGVRAPVLMIGLRVDTVAECTRLCAAESVALTALRLLS